MLTVDDIRQWRDHPLNQMFLQISVSPVQGTRVPLGETFDTLLRRIDELEKDLEYSAEPF